MNRIRVLVHLPIYDHPFCSHSKALGGGGLDIGDTQRRTNWIRPLNRHGSTISGPPTCMTTIMTSPGTFGR